MECIIQQFVSRDTIAVLSWIYGVIEGFLENAILKRERGGGGRTDKNCELGAGKKYIADPRPWIFDRINHIW